MYERYVNIETALAHDDFAKASEAFQLMHGILHMVQTDGMDSAAKAAWDSLDGSIMRVLHPMAASADIAGMRDHFIDFTPLILQAVEKFGARSGSRARLYHCPMARKGQGGDWLQADTALLNRFFGKTMPKCGDFVKEVALIHT